MEECRMSVPAGERKEGKFHLDIKAEELALYTLTITANENVFLPVYKESLTDKINSLAIDTFLCIRRANHIVVRVGTCYQAEDWERRRKAQYEAIDHIKTLYDLSELAKRTLHLSAKRMKYWGSLIVHVRNKAVAWAEADEKRYSEECACN